MAKDIQQKRIQIFSALEIANMCGVVNQTAINWIRNGYLKAFNTPGGQYRVYKDDLVEFIKNRGMRVPDILADIDGQGANWKKLIIIDDDVGLNNAINAYLSKNFAELSVFQSFDGFDAGVQLVEKKPGFVLLDLALPGVNGQELCKRIKTNPSFGKPFVIVITALEDAGLESEMYRMGADKFFRKPLVMQDILQSIKVAIETD
jgi:two-component system, OmpR family, response regulator